MTSTRAKDPRQLPVQLNVSVPWAFREFLIEQANTEGLSLNKLVTKVLMAEFKTPYRALEAVAVREATKDAGATS